MSTSNFLSVAEMTANGAAQSHHSVAMDEFDDNEELNDDVGVSEKPLSRFEKSLFALISG
jgi:hypothetical protein